MKKKSSSYRWLKRHFKDPFVIQAKKEGFRSRAAYKLIEMNKKLSLSKTARSIIELGAVPGSWSQVVTSFNNQHKSQVIANDILSFEPLKGIDFILGDFTSNKVQQKIKNKFNKKVDLILSDISPNISGIKSIDQAKMLFILEEIVKFSREILTNKGKVLLKCFQGQGFDEFMVSFRLEYSKIRLIKPTCSRVTSSELYLYGEFSGK